MYESQTYDVIMKRMLDRVLQENTNVDTREGSILWNALAPAAVELAIAYTELDNVYSETFADTASREMLIKRAAERGIHPENATKAVLNGVFNMDIPIGTRFSHENLNYAAIEKISTGVYRMQCETPGTEGNNGLGTLIPIDYIEGLTSAENTEVLILGEGDEDTELLRKRYFQSLEVEPFGGNIADYKKKGKAISGVGGVKVFPAWNGGGTVKLVITDSGFGIPSAELVEVVQTVIDPTQNAGEGVGVAPIGHVVTVSGATSTTVDISATMAFESGWTFADLKNEIEAVIDAYFLELSMVWDDEANTIVRISQIESRILTISHVIDITGTTLNSIAANLTVDAENIPVRGVVNG